MAAQVRVLRQRIRSARGMKKITKAMELVATSRIAKAQARVAASLPYAQAITGVLTALASNASVDHPLLAARPTVRRAGVLLITSDRGLAGGYSTNAVKAAESLIARLRADGKEPVLFVVGRKGTGYYRFRKRPLAASWTGFSEQPTFADAREVGKSIIQAFIHGVDDTDEGPGADDVHGVDEMHIVYTHFKSLLTQEPVTRFIAPMEVEERPREEAVGLLPAYEFEPEAEALLDALLPKYVNTRIYAALLDAAASESAARRRAMKSATDNADDMIQTYTRQMNAARQAGITQEISEIVGGANALASAGREA